MKKLQLLLNNIGGFTEDQIQAILSSTSPIVLKKKDFLLEEGAFVNQLYFIEEGFLRSFQLSDGMEISINFGQPNKFITAMNAYLQQGASEEYIQALTPASLLAIKKEKLEQLSLDIPRLGQLTQVMFQEIIQCKEDRIKSFIQQSTHQRYQNFIKDNPALAQIVSINHLSSYLGMAPETLSRVRAKK